MMSEMVALRRPMFLIAMMHFAITQPSWPMATSIPLRPYRKGYRIALDHPLSWVDAAQCMGKRKVGTHPILSISVLRYG